MGSIFSHLFHEVTGTNLSNVIAPVASLIPGVGSILAPIVGAIAGGGGGGAAGGNVNQASAAASVVPAEQLDLCRANLKASAARVQALRDQLDAKSSSSWILPAAIAGAALLLLRRRR